MMNKLLHWYNLFLAVSLQLVFYLCLIMMCIIFAVEISIVLMRYVMGVGFLELQDLVTYAFSTIVTLSVVLAFWKGSHIRVDVFHYKFKPNIITLVERIGSLFLILPVFTIILLNAWPLVYDSIVILEGSRETGGLGGLFLVKATVILMCLLIILLAVYKIINPTKQFNNDN